WPIRCARPPRWRRGGAIDALHDAPRLTPPPTGLVPASPAADLSPCTRAEGHGHETASSSARRTGPAAAPRDRPRDLRRAGADARAAGRGARPVRGRPADPLAGDPRARAAALARRDRTHAVALRRPARAARRAAARALPPAARPARVLPLGRHGR